ncbi:MAG TPA: acyl-CoA dehydrogenase family protein [Alphaproteobacteria bacterium]|nr:acyl-CoA dehydrogenase family protein [Alphaproteobacteria bacterium]
MNALRNVAVAPAVPETDWVERAGELGVKFAARAAAHDSGDVFVAANYADLKAAKVFSAGVPGELGGGGASHAELCAMLRTLARHCPSTALALAMHTHQVATPAWRWRNDRAPVDAFLRRIASEELVLLSSGGSDWLPGSGKAEKVEGGYRVTARKVFTSGAPGGDILMTGAIFNDPVAGPTVLHFAVPMSAAGVKLCDTWRVLGMRATGSHDVELIDVFVPDPAIVARRPAGKWHPMFHTLSMIAFPLIYSVYLGAAEEARNIAVAYAGKRSRDPHIVDLVGEMDTELTMARLAHEHMVQVAATAKPGPETTNQIMLGRTLVAKGALATVEKAMEAAGGGGFYRDAGLERYFRDVQACRYHPLTRMVQARYAGRMALGLDIDG